MDSADFAASFAALTGNPPFPWQQSLFERFILGDAAGRFPATCDIPTGLGKTSVIAVWLLALAHHARAGRATAFPRRLVYVVNRRTVVDQSTREAERLRDALCNKLDLNSVAQALTAIAAKPDSSPLAISTLRGQFADNAEWRDDPARAAVVVGTVDMIGSRLLFSGYGRGFKSRPLHAAFLGQDTLLVHDEAHLEPAFQALVEAVHREQQLNDWERGRFHVMALSATARSRGEVFRISDADRANRVVDSRIHAKKAIKFHEISEDKRFAEAALELALDDSFVKSERAILIFSRLVKDAEAIVKGLRKAGRRAESLTGTLRGLERDLLATTNSVFARFMPPNDRQPKVVPTPGTVYLVCTSAGEVGVNISADHLICDLSPLDSMAQRFGRVNRFGSDPSHIARVEILAPLLDADADDAYGAARARTLALLRQLPQLNETSELNGSPSALGALLVSLQVEDRNAAFSPQPTILPATDILFDAWAMTTIRDLPGRPPVEDYLHGVSEYEPAETHVAWREEVERVPSDRGEPNDLLEDFPLKAHELLRDRTDRVLGELEKIVERHPEANVWIVSPLGVAAEASLASRLAVADRKRLEREFRDCTVLLPPYVGALEQGLLAGEAAFVREARATYDVSDRWLDSTGAARRSRTESPIPPKGMRLVRAIDLTTAPEDTADGDEPASNIWYWYVQPASADDDGSRSARAPELLSDHLRKAGVYAESLARQLVAEEEATAVARAAEWHDLGKNRRIWQRSIGNVGADVLAKSGPRMRPREITHYRHELGSILDLEAVAGFSALTAEQRALLAHLIAAHHGRARPHFPKHEAFDPEHAEEKVTAAVREVSSRFSQLQRRYGRWGLAYLESLVRAADALASQDIGVAADSSEAAE